MNETMAVCMTVVFVVLIVATCYVRVVEETQETSKLRLEIELSKLDREVVYYQHKLEELKKENLNEKEHQ